MLAYNFASEGVPTRPRKAKNEITPPPPHEPKPSMRRLHIQLLNVVEIAEQPTQQPNAQARDIFVDSEGGRSFRITALQATIRCAKR